MSFKDAEDFVARQRQAHAPRIAKCRDEILDGLDKEGLDVATGGRALIYISDKQVPCARIVCEELNRKGMDCRVSNHILNENGPYVRIKLPKKGD